MVEMRVVKEDGKEHGELRINKNTLKKKKPANVKHLRFARDLPIRCDECKFRPKQEGGNGICSVYEKGALCAIRKDVLSLIKQYETRNPDTILPLMEEEFMNNYTKLKTFEALEDMASELSPEVTKRIGVLDKLGKTINEMKTTRSSIEIEEKKMLSEDKKEEIRHLLRVTQESSNESN